MRAGRALVGGLLAAAAGGAGARVVSSSPATRLGAGFLILLLVALVAGVVRGRPWALGASFLLGVCALWAVVALGLRQQVGAGTAAFGIAWALAVMVGSVRASGRAR